MTGQPEMRPLLEAYQGKPMVTMVLIALPTFPTLFFLFCMFLPVGR